jgi:hypothetical protein
LVSDNYKILIHPKLNVLYKFGIQNKILARKIPRLFLLSPPASPTSSSGGNDAVGQGGVSVRQLTERGGRILINFLSLCNREK